jgi:hypothetical protein
MKLRRRPRESPPEGYVGDHADKLSHVRGVSHAEDEERPTAEDRTTYRTAIDEMLEPVPLPRWLRPRPRSRKRSR